MKLNVTAKQIKDNYKNIICVGYCDLQYLLRCKDADFYTCGVYGWNADIYKINNSTVIVTGYRPFGNIEAYDLIEKYEKKAEKIYCDHSLEYKQIAKKLDKLLDKFINEALKGGN